jgi:hypothetical protein
MKTPPPIYQPPTAPLTREDVQGMIDRAIAAHTNEGLLASAGGALLLGALVWAMSAG